MAETLAARRGDVTNRQTLVVAVGLLLVPFIQFGVSYWLSVQGALFIYTLWFVRKRLDHKQALLLVAIALTMLASLLGHAYADTLFYAFLRIVRQLVCLFLILCAATSVTWQPGLWFYRSLLPALAGALATLVIVQYVTYTFAGWTYFFVPSFLYVQGYNTLADAWLQFGQLHGIEVSVRPSATFSEPSYFGFISLALAMLILKGVQGWLRPALLSLLLVALLCSRSASGVVLYVSFVVFAYRRLLSLKMVLILAALGVLGLVGLDLFLDFHLMERVLNITDPAKERSGYTRLVLPLQHIRLVLEHRPLGVPLSELFALASRHLGDYAGAGAYGPVDLSIGMTDGTDNGFLNMFISYGFGAFAIIGLICAIVRDKLTLVFLLFAAQFNGDLFSPDKAAVVALALACQQLAPAVAAKARRVPKPLIVTGPFGATFGVRR